MKDPRSTEPRLHSLLAGAPNWAAFLVLLVCAMAGEKLVAAVADLFHPATPKWDEDLGDGYTLLHFNGKTRTQLLRENVPDSVLKLAERRLAQYGLSIPDPDKGDREAGEQRAKLLAAAEREAAKAAKANAGKPQAGNPVQQPSGAPVLALASGMTFVAGVSVQELVDRAKTAASPDDARKELLAVDGISPDVATELLALAAK